MSPPHSSELLSKLTLVLLDPASNLKAAFLLYGSIAVALVIVMIIAIMIITAFTKEDETPEDRETARRPSAPGATLGERSPRSSQ